MISSITATIAYLILAFKMPVAGTDVEYILASTYPPKNVQKVNVQ
jgi:hypothetical protein